MTPKGMQYPRESVDISVKPLACCVRSSCNTFKSIMNYCVCTSLLRVLAATKAYQHCKTLFIWLKDDWLKLQMIIMLCIQASSCLKA